MLFQTKHLRKAAEAVNLSHGAFHKSMQALQEEIGYPLYTVEGRNIVITPRGFDFYERAKDFLEAEAAFLKQSRSPSKNTGLRIGTHETFSTYLIARCSRAYLKDATFTCRDLLPGRLEEAIELGIVDVGITYEHVPRMGLDAVRLGSTGMGIYVRKDIFKKAHASELPYVAPALPLETTPSHAKGLDGWPELHVSRNVTYRVDLVSTAVQLAGSGSCAVFIPHFVARGYNEGRPKPHRLSMVTPPKGFKAAARDVFIIQRTGAAPSDLVRRVAMMVKAEACDG